MTTIYFDVPAVPVPQPRQRHARRGNFVHNYTPADHPVQSFKASVRMAAQKAYKKKPLDRPIKLTLVFVLPRPQRLIWKKRDMPRCRHTAKPDLDNLVKSVKDALSKLVWRDDSLICSLIASKYHASGDEQPHVEVTIVPLDQD